MTAAGAALLGLTMLTVPLGRVTGAGPGQYCPEPARVSREEILDAMRRHGDYSITSTTTATRFGAEALLEIVRRRQQVGAGPSQLFIPHDDWFSAHLQIAGVSYPEMPETARAAFEHRQDAIVDYGPDVVEAVEEGPRPVTALDVTIFWPDTGTAPAEISYRDTLSQPPVDVFDQRVIRFKLLEYDSMLVFDEVSGIAVRPRGFLSVLFAVVGKPDLKQNRLAVAEDEWQIMRPRVSVLLGINKTGNASIEPGGRGHEGIPAGRPDLQALARHLKQPLRLRYREPSCQIRLAAQGRERSCPRAMGGLGDCAAD